ncbi:MAG: DUF1778 domain-containing protein [Proteobacteria bacterium]|jgi:uncharacterized protein (DUF1778 family)|nr:DUF1778 domain-containing protein [Pseudomonadota bacterium]
MTTTALIERGRITARVPLAVQETLEMAASLMGATLNQFVVQAALHEAERIIEQERVIRMSVRDTKAFLATLDQPLPPNDKLKSALENYLARRNDQTGTIDWAPRQKRI